MANSRYAVAKGDRPAAFRFARPGALGPISVFWLS